MGDALFLHQKLSSLKGVGAPSSMLQTIVSELPIQQAAPTPRPSPFANTNSSANQRIRGMLARQNTAGPLLEKSLPGSPSPARSPTPSRSASQDDAARWQEAENRRANGSALVLPPSPQPGFRQDPGSPIPPLSEMDIQALRGAGHEVEGGLLPEEEDVPTGTLSPMHAMSPRPSMSDLVGNGTGSRPSSPRPNSPRPYSRPNSPRPNSPRPISPRPQNSLPPRPDEMSD